MKNFFEQFIQKKEMSDFTEEEEKEPESACNDTS